MGVVFSLPSWSRQYGLNNFSYLRYHDFRIVISDRPIILDFNPWWFSGREDLTKRYFRELLIALDKLPGVAEGLVKKLTGPVDMLSQAPVPHASWLKTLRAPLMLIRHFHDKPPLS